MKDKQNIRLHSKPKFFFKNTRKVTFNCLESTIFEHRFCVKLNAILECVKWVSGEGLTN